MRASAEPTPSMLTLEFTGERFIPGDALGEIAYEHWHRYALARRYASGKRALDAACGEGYGTALIAAVAEQAVGVDIDAAAIDHARANYSARPRLRFEQGSVTALPMDAASVDLVVSFETIEHLPAPDQPRMLAEFARVLVPDGLLLLSSPNRRKYSDERNYRNPFHLHELYRDELEHLLDAHFPHRRWFHQTRSFTSALWSEDVSTGARTCEAWIGDGDDVVPMPNPDGLYYIVLAARSPGAMPSPYPQLSLFADRDETELKRVEANVRENLRLDGLLKDRDAAADRQMEHIQHLENLVAIRERIVVERDAQLVQVNAAREAHEQGLAAARAALAQCESDLSGARGTMAAMQRQQREQDAAIAAQERLIAYRQSARWWVRLPWMRMRLLWQRVWGR